MNDFQLTTQFLLGNDPILDQLQNTFTGHIVRNSTIVELQKLIYGLDDSPIADLLRDLIDNYCSSEDVLKDRIAELEDDLEKTERLLSEAEDELGENKDELKRLSELESAFDEIKSSLKYL